MPETGSPGKRRSLGLPFARRKRQNSTPYAKITTDDYGEPVSEAPSQIRPTSAPLDAYRLNDDEFFRELYNTGDPHRRASDVARLLTSTRRADEGDDQREPTDDGLQNVHHEHSFNNLHAGILTRHLSLPLRIIFSPTPPARKFEDEELESISQAGSIAFANVSNRSLFSGEVDHQLSLEDTSAVPGLIFTKYPKEMSVAELSEYFEQLNNDVAIASEELICELSAREGLLEHRTTLQREADYQSRRVIGSTGLDSFPTTSSDGTNAIQRGRRRVSAPVRVYQSLFSVADV